MKTANVVEIRIERAKRIKRLVAEYGKCPKTDLAKSVENLKNQISAEKIKSILVEKGIKKKRLKTSGYGSTKPLEKNDTEEHRKENRRVDFVIVK